MAGSSNFLQFNPDKNNQSSDASYSGSTYRSGGIPAAPSAAPSDVHNKLFYQTTTMAAALAQVMANRGLTVSDADLNSLIAVLDKIITLDSNGDMKTGSSGGNADTATKLKTARKINSVPFDGTSDITVADPTKLPADGNAVSASKLAVARTISLTGDVSGSVSFDGSSNKSMEATVIDDSHNHTAATLPSVTLYDTFHAFGGNGSNGYQKLSNGLLIQWGKVNEYFGDGQWKVVYFPIAFPNACFSVVQTPADGGFGGDGPSPAVTTLKTTNFQAGTFDGGMNGMTWIAIGY